MGKCQYTFKRYEKKYLLEPEKYEILINRLQDYMKIDAYGLITICNIYFDTPDHRLIRASLEKPVYKEKLRLRSYGVPEKGDPAFIELKKKYKGIVYKRRIKTDLASAEVYLYQSKQTLEEGQIKNEIDWFLKFYSDIRPSMYISYDRIAMYGLEDKDLRVTFDSNITWREEDLWLEHGIWGNSLLEKDEKLMEVKISKAMPIWMAKLFDELKIYPTSFSKYGKSYLESLTKRNKVRKDELLYA
ncbi:MAG: VTC domain-containing protein [Lachnoclostridium sp.]|jgi:hypothetical protein